MFRQFYVLINLLCICLCNKYWQIKKSQVWICPQYTLYFCALCLYNRYVNVIAISQLSLYVANILSLLTALIILSLLILLLFLVNIGIFNCCDDSYFIMIAFNVDYVADRFITTIINHIITSVFFHHCDSYYCSYCSYLVHLAHILIVVWFNSSLWDVTIIPITFLFVCNVNKKYQNPSFFANAK